jgi:hypothetical protein
MITTPILSIDTEFDGDSPGINNLRSIGAALMQIEAVPNTTEYTIRLLSQFEVHLHDLPDCRSNPGNMEFWEKYQQAWYYARQNAINPKRAMEHFHEWMDSAVPNEYICATWPGSSDVAFVEYYSKRFLDKMAFKGFPLDARSYFFAQSRGTSWKDCGMNSLPSGWKPENPTPHRAGADAIAQGYMIARMFIEHLKP